MENITQAFIGFNTGWVAAREKFAEDEYQQGANIGIPSLCQFVQLTLVVELGYILAKMPMSSEQSFALKGWDSLSQRIFCVYCIPFINAGICQWTRHNQEKGPHFTKVYKVSYLLLRHIGTVSQIALTVAAIGLIGQGHYTRGMTTLACLIYGLAERRKYVPQSVRGNMRIVGAALSLVGSLFKDSWLMKAVALIELAGMVTTSVHRRQALSQQSMQATKLPMNDIKNLPNNSSIYFFPVNEAHYSAEIYEIPPAPQIDLEVLIAKFMSFDWSKDPYNTELLTVLCNDDNWQKLPVEERTDPIGYVQHRLEQFVFGIKNESIDAGEPIDYGRLKLLSAHIANLLPQQTEERQVELLLRLSLTGSYCGGGFITYVEKIYWELVDDPQTLELQGQVLRVLQKRREGMFDERILKAGWFNIAYWHMPFLAQNNVHKYNAAVTMVGTELGLPLAKTLQAQAISASWLEKYNWNNFFIPEFKTEYEGVIRTTVRDGVANKEISLAALQDWTKQQGLDPDDVFDQDGFLSWSGAQLLLINCGVYSIPS